jgi:Glycosyl transferase family, a/b domain/Glycosyl transferase family, helical bundle domain
MDISIGTTTSESDFKSLLGKLVKSPENFTPNDLKLALDLLFTPNVVNPAQIVAFLTALHFVRIERRPESLAAAASVLRNRALKAVLEDRDRDVIVDIVGTGGDGFNTFNVSTTAAVVAAGAGARVVKVRYRPKIYFVITDANSARGRVVTEPRHPLQVPQTSSKPSAASSNRQTRTQNQQQPSNASHSRSSSHRNTTPPWNLSHRTANPSPSAPYSTSSDP